MAGPGMGARMARCTVKTGAGPGFGRPFSLLGRAWGEGAWFCGWISSEASDV